MALFSNMAHAHAGANETCVDEVEMVTATTGPVSFAWGTYYGQSINTVFNDVKIDASGNSYAFGSTIHQGFDGILAKFDAAGVLQWERHLGGSDTDNFNSDDNFDYGKLALDNSGNIYVTGITQSDNFPTVNAFQANRSGGIDAFVAKYDSDGNLLLSSYLGGAANENIGGAGDIAIDASGNIFVSGTTSSTAFFNSASAHQSNFSGGTEVDIYVVKIVADFSSVSGTYWGDQGMDISRGIDIDANGTVWVVGAADRSGLSLPGATANSIDGMDGLVLGFNNALSQLTNGTFFGGIFDDEITDVATDASGDLYLTGGTYSTSDFPTVNAFEANYQGGQMGFATKMSATGSLIWSTFIGGSQNEIGKAIAIDASNNVYVTGMTASRDFPDHRSAQATFNNWTCSEDGFIFKFNADGTQDWASYYGGWREELPTGIAVGSNDQVVIVGKTKSIDLPTTVGAHQASVNFAGPNAFVATFELACPAVPIIIHSTENALYYDKFWCNAYTSPKKPYFNSDTCALLFIAPAGYTDYQWFRNGNALSQTGQIITAQNPGSGNSLINYHVEISNIPSCAGNAISPPKKINWVRPMCGFGSSFNSDEMPHTADILEGYDNEFFCVGDPVNFNLSTDGFCESSVQWQKDFEDIPNATDFNFNVTEIGCYRVAVTNNFTGCTVYSQSKIFVLLDTILLNDYYAYQSDTECIKADTLEGCSSVFLKARINTCINCHSTPRGISYQWLRDGAPISGGSNGQLSTSIEGDYLVKINFGSCEIISNPVHVQIKPTEPPIWIAPNTNICIAQLDSLLMSVTHPSATDSATIRFDLPYPMTDIVGYDSVAVVYNPTSGCVDVDITRRDGCYSTSLDIEFHDSLSPTVQIQGPSCLPVTLRMQSISSCHMDSVFWMKGDSVVRKAHYSANYNVQEAGDYHYIIKNECGSFTSDTVTIQGNLPTPTISPVGPVCLPANISLDFPNPDSSIIIHWYKNTSATGCYTHAQYLIPDEHGTNLVAGLPGFYFAVLEDTISGCKSLCTDKVEVQQSAAGSNLNPSNNIYFCDGDGTDNVTFSVNQANSSFTYQWFQNNVAIPSATNPTYTTNAEGVYRVFLENSCDNAFTPTVSIYNIANPTLEINTADTIYLCGPDTIRLPTTFDQPLLFEWYQDDVIVADSVDSFLLATVPGKYQVYGLNNNSQCEDWSKEVYILNSPTIKISIDVLPNCSGVCTGELAAQVTGGVPFPDGSYLYHWENGKITSSITQLCSGNFSLTITDAVGCNTVATATVDDGFSVQSTVDSISCFMLTDGAINTSITGGLAPFQYLWSNGDTTASLSQLAAGNYTLKVRDSLNCMVQQQYDLGAPPELTIALSQTDASCFAATNGSIQAVPAGGKLPYALTWNTPIILDSNMLAAGMYTVTLSDNNNCELIDSILIGEPAVLSVAMQITDSLDCHNSVDGTLSALPNGGTPTYQYLWSDNSTGNSISGLGAGSYSVTITDANLCTDSASINLTAASALALTIDAQQNIDCFDGSDGAIQASATGGTAPFQFFQNNTAVAAGNMNNLLAGSYELYVVDAKNCSSATTTVQLTQPDSISISVATVPVSCPNTATGSASLTVSGGTAGYQYLWSNGMTSDTSSALAAGTYNVVVTDTNGCQQNISFDIIEPAPLQTDYSIAAVQCFGGNSGSVSVNASTGGTAPYSYYLTGGNFAMDNQQMDSLLIGNYTLRTVDAVGCAITNEIIITEPTALSATLTVMDSLLCNGASDGSLLIAAAGGTAPYQFLWEDGSSDTILSNLATGDYVVEVKDANACAWSDQVNLPDGPLLEISISNQKDISCWGAADGAFSVLPNGGNGPFQYYFDQQAVPTNEYVDLAPGSYEVYFSDSNNCLSDTKIVEIVSPSALAVTTTETAVLCPGGNTGTVEILASGGIAPYQYQWSNGLDRATSDSLAAGSYTVIVKDKNNCWKTISFDIAQPQPLTVDYETTETSCFEAADGAVTIEFASGGTAPYVHYLDEQAIASTDLSVQGLAAGDYLLRTVDDHGCEAEEALQIIEPAQFTVDLGADQEIIFGQNVDLPISTQNGSGVINYSFSPTDYLDCPSARLSDCPTPRVITPLNDISYAVLFTDAHGCEAAVQLRINVIRPNENIYLGNALNMNSQEGNDIFFVQSNAAVQQVVKFQIFNRWGASVFEANNFPSNDKSYGWDGYFKSKPVATGVYIYVVEYLTIEGKLKMKSGDLSVLR